MNRSKITRALLMAGLSPLVVALAHANEHRPYRYFDANDVDLVTGETLPRILEGVVGPADAALQLYRVSAGNNESSQWDRIHLEQGYSNSETTITVWFDRQSEKFTGSFGSFSSVDGNGSTLTVSGNSYIHTRNDGTVTVFSSPISQVNTRFCSGTQHDSCVLLPRSITSPSGDETLLHWGTSSFCTTECHAFYRLAAVSNNRGYRIDFTYELEVAPGGTAPPANWWTRTGAQLKNEKITPDLVGTISYNYPATGGVDVTDASGAVWKIRGGYSSISSITRPGDLAPSLTIARPSATDLVVTRDGVTTQYARSQNGGTTTMVALDALGGQRTVVSDVTIGRPLSDADQLGNTTQYVYDSLKRLSRVTSPEGNYVEYQRDARGNITQEKYRDKSGSAVNDRVIQFHFPSNCLEPAVCNKPVKVVDPMGRETDYTYSPDHGGVLTITKPAAGGGVRPQTRYSYISAGGIYRLSTISECITSSSCDGTGDERKITFAYDVNGNVISETVANGDNSLSAQVAREFDAAGNLVSVDGPLPGADDTTNFKYDGARRQVGVIGPDPDGSGNRPRVFQENIYDAAGRIIETSIGTVAGTGDTEWNIRVKSQSKSINYDANSRPVSERIVANGVTYSARQTNYDALGRIKCVVQRMNPSTFGALSTDACALSSTGSLEPDRVTKFSYDASSKIIRVQKGVGTVDAADDYAATYTANGKVATLQDGEGNKTSYVYDGHDQLHRTNYPAIVQGTGTSNSADYEQYGYDAVGNLTSIRKRDGIVTNYEFDNLDRLVRKDLPNAEQDVYFSYDLIGNIKSVTQAGQTVTLAYDALGRKISQSDVHGTISSTFDAAGRRTSLTYPGSALTVNYDYDAVGNVLKIRENNAVSGVGVLASYEYTPLGLVSRISFGNGTVQGFNYDPVSRLSYLANDLEGLTTTHDLTKSFSHNAAGQLASVERTNDTYAWQGHFNVYRQYVTNGLNQYVSSGSVNFTYDTKGNLSSDGTGSFAYSSENRLTSALGGVSLIYDPLGRLASVGSSSAFTRFHYDDLNLIAELDSNNSIQRRYVHAPGMDKPIVWYEGATIDNSTRRFLMADERGSIISITNSGGSVLGINTYDEFGIPGSGNIGRFGFTGQTWIPELGMWNYKARIYSPTLGRYLQTDPIGYADGINWYDYVSGDPINYSDFMGLDRICNAGGGPCVDPGYPDIIVEATGGTYISSAAHGINLSLGVIFWGGIGGREEREEERPQNGPCKDMDPALEKGREFFGSLSNWSGNAANGLALAGAVPTPASPALGAASAGARALSFAASGTQMLLSGVHYAQTGDAQPFFTDFSSAGLGAFPVGKFTGKLTGHAGTTPGGVSDKFGQTATDTVYGAALSSIKLGC